MDINLGNWWDTLSTIQQIYWGFAIPFTIIFLLQMILTFVGGELHSDGSVDVEIDHDHGVGFQFFTIKNFVGFFTIFSWTGIAGLNAGFSNEFTILISIVSGILMMALMGAIFYYFSQLTDSGTMDIKNAIGGVGEVYLTIKAKRGNIGKVHIKVQSSLRELEAITDDDEDLSTGMVISVKEVINDDILLVSKSI